MVTTDILFQRINWRHDPIEGEPFDHIGTLNTGMIIPKVSIGLSDWWNITLEQIIGYRYMGWSSDSISVHHREEGSDSNFNNAEGGILGDSKLQLKYLIFNEGRGIGSRFYIGAGIILPSKNQLTNSPFLKNKEGNYLQHRHFSMSSGLHKLNLSLQYYYKRNLNPVFFGTTFSYSKSIKDSQYGYGGSENFDISISALFNESNFITLPLSFHTTIAYTTPGYWNEILTPNSESLIITPGIGILGSIGSTSFALNIQIPIYNKGMIFPESNNNPLNNQSNGVQISLSIRSILDIYIPWLYW